MNLHPGELFVASEPTKITTLLGSCVSVCLFCPRRKIGAMCHGVMPVRRADLCQEESFRFVESSVRYMVEVMSPGNLFGSSTGLVAKVFGGADVLGRVNKERNGETIGAMNIRAAREALIRCGVEIAVEKVGGVYGCKLFFYTHTGEVLLRRIPRSLQQAGFHGK
ncbi:MAG: chemotaxis protein CheD [Desulfobulbaceae bacterium]|nr:chemotaxis protein CheD [Desulfobulbaceae bacterium]